MILIRQGPTEFNRIFSVTRRDPLDTRSETGPRQAGTVAAAPRALNLRRSISTLYRPGGAEWNRSPGPTPRGPTVAPNKFTGLPHDKRGRRPLLCLRVPC